MKHCKSMMLDTLQPLPESVTLCATVNEAGDEQVITELMIRRACEQMDDTQMWPFSNHQCCAYVPAPEPRSATILPFVSPRRVLDEAAAKH